MSGRDSGHTVYKTKERFFPVTQGDDPQRIGTYPGQLVNGANDDAWMIVHIPQNFKSLTQLTIRLIPAATATPMFFQVQTNYAGPGELYDINSENGIGKPLNTVLNTLTEFDIMDLVDTRAVKPGDSIGIQVTHVSNTNAYILGVRISYKPKSKD